MNSPSRFYSAVGFSVSVFIVAAVLAYFVWLFSEQRAAFGFRNRKTNLTIIAAVSTIIFLVCRVPSVWFYVYQMWDKQSLVALILTSLYSIVAYGSVLVGSTAIVVRIWLTFYDVMLAMADGDSVWMELVTKAPSMKKESRLERVVKAFLRRNRRAHRHSHSTETSEFVSMHSIIVPKRSHALTLKSEISPFSTPRFLGIGTGIVVPKDDPSSLSTANDDDLQLQPDLESIYKPTRSREGTIRQVLRLANATSATNLSLTTPRLALALSREPSFILGGLKSPVPSRVASFRKKSHRQLQAHSPVANSNVGKITTAAALLRLKSAGAGGTIKEADDVFEEDDVDAVFKFGSSVDEPSPPSDEKHEDEMTKAKTFVVTVTPDQSAVMPSLLDLDSAEINMSIFNLGDGCDSLQSEVIKSMGPPTVSVSTSALATALATASTSDSELQTTTPEPKTKSARDSEKQSPERKHVMDCSLGDSTRMQPQPDLFRLAKMSKSAASPERTPSLSYTPSPMRISTTSAYAWFLRNKGTYGNVVYVSVRCALMAVIIWIAVVIFTGLHLKGPYQMVLFALWALLLTLALLVLFVKYPSFHDALRVGSELKALVYETGFFFVVYAVGSVYMIVAHIDSKDFWPQFAHQSVSALFSCLFVLTITEYVRYRFRQRARARTKGVDALIAQMVSPNTVTVLRQLSPEQKLLTIIGHDDGFRLFMQHLVKEFSIENLICVYELVQFREVEMHSLLMSLGTDRQRVSLTKQHNVQFPPQIIDGVHSAIACHSTLSSEEKFIALVDKYIAETAELCVNISYRCRRALLRMADEIVGEFLEHGFALKQVKHTVFDGCIHELVRLMIDSLGRFQRTPQFLSIADDIAQSAE